MADERRERAWAVFDQLAKVPADQREAVLRAACGDDLALRAEVERLLALDDRLTSVEGQAGFLESPLVRTPSPTDHIQGPAAPFQGKFALPHHIGRYRILRLLGEGGMGAVYEAEQDSPQRAVALKVIRPGLLAPAFLKRFKQEVEILGRLHHPGIAQIYEAGVAEDGQPFFAMEYIRGLTLGEYARVQSLTVQARVELMARVCDAAQHAHDQGVIHRDLKPANILVDESGQPKVLDFGVARATDADLLTGAGLTQTGQLLGTPNYMSPEQLTGDPAAIDQRADVYALGVILFELLAHALPYQLTNRPLAEAALMIREQDAPRLGSINPELRGDVETIVGKALAKDRARRYPSAAELAADLRRWLAHEPIQARPPSALYHLRKFARRHKGLVGGVVATAMALVLGLVGTILFAVGEARQRRQADDEKREAKFQEYRARIAAEAERLAKLDADAKRKEAERNLAFAKKGNVILGSVFAGLDPKQIAESGRPLQDVLRQNLSKAVKELEGSAIGEPLEVAAMQETLGMSLLGLGEASLAVEVFQKALATRKAKLGPDHPDTLDSMDHLATAYQAGDQLAKAVPLFEETLEKTKAKLGPDHPDTLASMNNLALAYYLSGQLAKAVPLYEESLEKSKAKRGPDHPNTLITMHNLARAYQASGQLTKAMPLYEETLEKQKAKLGPDHPDMLASMNSLALGYLESGQLAKALPLLEETLVKKKAKLGPDHPSTLISMNELALVYQSSGQLGKALTLFKETLEKSTAKLGPDHTETLSSMHNLAVAYLESGQLAKALPLLEETLVKYKAKLGPDHPATLKNMHNLAWAYRDSNQLARAVPLYEETLVKRKAKLGPDHPETLVTMDHLATAYQASGQLAKAVTLWEEALPKQKAKFGAEHPQTVGTMANLGLAVLQQKKWADAEPLLRDCLAIREKHIPDSWLTFDTQSMLGGALLGQKKYAEAEPLLLKGYEGMKTREKTIPKAGGAELRIPEAVDRLIELYTAINKPAEANKWQAERAKYPQGKTKKPETK